MFMTMAGRLPGHFLLLSLTSFSHGRARPGHPDRTSAALETIGITGTRPVMT
jgi:hypothetical protein